MNALSAVTGEPDPGGTPPRPSRTTVVVVSLIGAVAPWLAWPTVNIGYSLAFGLAWAAQSAWALVIAPFVNVAAAVGLWVLIGRVARAAGAHRPRLVTATAMAGVVAVAALMYGSRAYWDDGEWLLASAAMSAAGAVGCCLAALPPARRHSWIPFAPPAAVLPALVVLAPVFDDLQARSEIHAVIDAHGQEFAILDDAAWRPTGVGERYDTLRVTYASADDEEETVTVGSWDEDRRFNANTPYTLRHSCDYDQMTCTVQGDLLVREEEGVVNEVRLTLDDGTVVAVQADRGGDVDLVAVAEHVRQATAADRDALVEALV